MGLAELLTLIVDAVVSIAVLVIAARVAPEQRDLALAIVAALQGIAAALIVYFLGDAKIKALRMEIQRLKR